MELSDLFLAPIYLGILYALAYLVRPAVTNQFTKPYFIPALTLKFVGAIGLGLLYQFYYGYGDTLQYHYHARVISDAFSHSFSTGLTLLLDDGSSNEPVIAPYAARMLWHSPGSAELLLSRIAAFFGLLCFNNYTVISLFFAITSFSGMWAMYMTFATIRPQVYKELAWTLFYVPSLFFWGSGILKDSMCMGALGWLFYALYQGAIRRRSLLRCVFIGVMASYILFRLKVYILLSFLPAALLWVFNETSGQVRNPTLRLLARPVFLAMGGVVAFYAATNLTADNSEYAIENIGERSKITADYIYEQSQLQEGSAYSLGKLDGTISSMVKLAPQAIGTSLFRPFLWEVRNPIMLLSAIEAFYFLFFTLRILRRTGIKRTFSIIGQTPVLLMCFVFSLIFAASVGITSNNFGTLARYKIPMIPFYLSGLYILQSIAVPVKGIKLRRREITASY